MKAGKQKIFETKKTYPQKNRTASEGYVEGQTFMGITENHLTINQQSGHELLDYILSPSNLNAAYKRVRRNKSVSKMKARIKELTSRSNGWSNRRRKESLRQYITGWVNYFKLADMKKLLSRIDSWLRRRLRMVIWKQWKRIRTKCKNLIKLGINRYKAYEWANRRKGYWHIANSWILSMSITSYRLRESGFVFFSDCYSKVRVAH